MANAKDAHTISVIIPTLGRDTLAKSRAALARQTRPPDEVIVVLDRERRGVSWARNEGLRQAHGDLIAFTDDDVMTPPDWLEQLVGAIDAYHADGAGGTFQETDALLDEIRGCRPLPDTVQVDAAGLVGNGGNILFRRACLDACARHDGYIFNERFPNSGEDWELVWRLRIRGAVLVYVPVHPLHLRRVTPRSYLRHQLARGIGIALLFKLQRRLDTDLVLQESLIWGGKDIPPWRRWATAFWQKGVGPFDRSEFSCARHFWLHWLAEKAQGAGFLWGLIRR